MRFKKRSGFHVSFDKALDRRYVRFWGDDEETTTTTVTPQPVQLPGYAESDAARKQLGEKTTEWGKDPNYGLIQPNWENIYGQAKKRIGEYYWGSAMQPGIMQKIQASAARRNVSGSPAADIMKGRMGVEEAGQLGQISSDIDLQKALSGERAREFWAASSGQLSQQKPSFAMGSTTTTTSPGEDLWGQIIGGGAQIAGNYVLGNQIGAARPAAQMVGGMGGQTPTSLTDRGRTSSFSNYGDNWLADLY